jgi:hypothetical protein
VSKERLAALTRRLDSFGNSTTSFLKELTTAQANVEQLRAFQVGRKRKRPLPVCLAVFEAVHNS